MPKIYRRSFVGGVALGGAGLGLGLPAVAGPFGKADFHRGTPADKKLSREWLRSLRERGTPGRLTGGALNWVGMPIGGLCAGQLYLGGDGRLWHWDIFESKDARPGPVPEWGVGAYAQPLVPWSTHKPKHTLAEQPFEHGFAIRVRPPGGQWAVRRLDRRGFRNISFLGQYPIGEVVYCDVDYPVTVQLQAFSPFIPLDVASSSFPATILNYSVSNTGQTPLEFELIGWLQNPVCLSHEHGATGQRRNAIESLADRTTLHCTADASARAVPAYGSMALTVAGAPTGVKAASQVDAAIGPEGIFDALAPAPHAPEGAPFRNQLVGALGSAQMLAPGQSTSVPFVLSWFFPNYHVRPKSEMSHIRGIQSLKRHYATRFNSASEVAAEMVRRFDELVNATKLWRSTWYDSSLPFWFLDRTLLNVSTLATQTSHRFDNGRFWGWEGVYCCGGTCQHVWAYAQSVARLFPEIERNVRQVTDFDIAWNPATGAMAHRPELRDWVAHDGFCATILRAYREHQMSADDRFLRGLWPRIKKSMQFVTAADSDGDGILDQAQANTLDATWYGKIPWISSLYIAAARATQAMAEEMGDPAFAAQLKTIVDNGYRSIPRLFDGEYFIHEVDPRHPNTINTNRGCHADQVFGQSYAFQLGLGRILPEKETRTALRSLWRYNFTPDIGPHRKKSKLTSDRWYAMPGEGGLIMCTWPKGGEELAPGRGNELWKVGYFIECWTGQEHQVASHMLWEGMVDEALAITRMVHDRHHPLRRNPYNEVECGDHYARAMSSHGSFIAACGFEYHGPRGYLGFHPRISPEAFRAAFVAAEGWGSFSQQRSGTLQLEQIDVQYGQLRLTMLGFELAPGSVPRQVTVQGNNAGFRMDGTRIQVDLSPLTLRAGESLRVEIHA